VREDASGYAQWGVKEDRKQEKRKKQNFGKKLSRFKDSEDRWV